MKLFFSSSSAGRLEELRQRFDDDDEMMMKILLGPGVPLCLCQTLAHQPPGVNDASLQSLHGAFTAGICGSDLLAQLLDDGQQLRIFTLRNLTAIRTLREAQ